MTRRTKTGVMMMTIEKAFVGTQPVASLHGRSVAEDAIETTHDLYDIIRARDAHGRIET
jgi:hypothetical protein